MTITDRKLKKTSMMCCWKRSISEARRP